MAIEAADPVTSAITLNIIQVSSIPSIVTSTTCQYHGNCSPNQCDSDWIVDLGATNHMTFDSNDFSCIIQLRQSMISNSNSITYLVIGVGILYLTPY